MQNITIPKDCECGCKSLTFLERQKVKKAVADAVRDETKDYNRWTEVQRYKDPSERKPYSKPRPQVGKAFEQEVEESTQAQIQQDKHLKNTAKRKQDWEQDYERICQEGKTPKNAKGTISYWQEKAAYTFHHEDLAKLQILTAQLETEKAMQRRTNEEQAAKRVKQQQEQQVKEVAKDRLKVEKTKERLTSINPNSIAAKMQKKYEEKKLKKSQT